MPQVKWLTTKTFGEIHEKPRRKSFIVSFTSLRAFNNNRQERHADIRANKIKSWNNWIRKKKMMEKGGKQQQKII